MNDTRTDIRARTPDRNRRAAACLLMPLVLVLAAVFSGSKPDSARSIRGTRMMTAGRVVLVEIALVLAFFGLHPWL